MWRVVFYSSILSTMLGCADAVGNSDQMLLKRTDPVSVSLRSGNLGDPAIPMPAYIFADSAVSTIARNLSLKCPNVRYDYDAERSMVSNWTQRLNADEVSRVQYNRFIRDELKVKMDIAFTLYSMTKELNWSDPSKVCAVAEKEIRLKTPIGQLLNSTEKQT